MKMRKKILAFIVFVTVLLIGMGIITTKSLSTMPQVYYLDYSAAIGFAKKYTQLHNLSHKEAEKIIKKHKAYIYAFAKQFAKEHNAIVILGHFVTAPQSAVRVKNITGIYLAKAKKDKYIEKLVTDINKITKQYHLKSALDFQKRRAF